MSFCVRDLSLPRFSSSWVVLEPTFCKRGGRTIFGEIVRYTSVYQLRYTSVVLELVYPNSGPAAYQRGARSVSSLTAVPAR